MSFLKWFKKKKETSRKAEIPEPNDKQQLSNEDEEKVDTTSHNDEDKNIIYDVKFVYFALDSPKNDILHVLETVTKDLQTFTVESECIEYITSITNNKVFLIIDGSPSSTLLEEMEKLNQIDSVFIFSSSSDSKALINQKKHSYFVHVCDYGYELLDSIRKSSEELDKYIAVSSMYDKKEKVIRDLSKELGSYLFFQLFKHAVKNIPKTVEAKRTMVTTCRNYYRENLTELANIDDFDKNYKSVDAIPWYMKECFLSKFINKVLRTENADALYQFRFFITDLSEQLQLKCLELRKKQNDVLKLYRGLKLSFEEIGNLQNSVGNIISINEYLTVSGERSIAYGFATKATKEENTARVLFEYTIDLNFVQTIVVADVREYSAFPEEAEFIFDMGSRFQIDSCQYDADADLWLITVHATDQGVDNIAEYMEYQKKKMKESNTMLMFGNLLLEMGEYEKAERYFDTILSSSNPNDEEIACIFFNFGRTYRLKGDYNRAINAYNRAYDLHMNAKPIRSASAGKSLHGLGVVYNEQEKLLKAEECFKMAMELYKKSLPKEHEDIAATLMNLGTIDSSRGNYDSAMEKYLHAKKIYDRVLPSAHPNNALLKVNLGNVYLAAGQYDKALEEYESALHLQEASLPSDHPDLAQTLHNLAVVQGQRGNREAAKEYLERAEVVAQRTLSAKHPLMASINKTKTFLVENIHDEE